MSKKISQLDTASKPLSGREIFILNQNGLTYSASLSDIREYTGTGGNTYDWIQEYSTSNAALSSNFVLKNSENILTKSLTLSGTFSNIVTDGFASMIKTLGPSSEILTIGDGSTIHTDGYLSPIYTVGEYSNIYTNGNTSRIYTEGEDSPIYTSGYGSPIITYGEASYIFTQGDNSSIYTYGTDSPIYTAGENAHIYTNANTAHVCAVYGNIGARTLTPTQALDINSDSFRLRNTKTPATSGATGEMGTICYDADYLYICVATDTWKRTALTPW